MALAGAALQPSCFDELRIGLWGFFFKCCFNEIGFNDFGLAQISFYLWHMYAIVRNCIFISLSHPKNFHWYCVLPVAENVNRLIA